MRLHITDPAGMWDVVLRCVSDAEVRDRKRQLRPWFHKPQAHARSSSLLAFAVDELARTVPPEHAIAGCDEGAWAVVSFFSVKRIVSGQPRRWVEMAHRRMNPPCGVPNPPRRMSLKASRSVPQPVTSRVQVGTVLAPYRPL